MRRSAKLSAQVGKVKEGERSRPCAARRKPKVKKPLAKAKPLVEHSGKGAATEAETAALEELVRDALKRAGQS